MFVLAVPFFALPSFVPPQCTEGPAPTIDLKAAYTRGEPISTIVDPANRLAFVAEGAEITILDIDPIPTAGEFSPLGSRVPVDCSPIAMALNGEDQLLIAGGSQGLWAIDLCTNLWQSTPTACSSYTPFLVDSATPQAFSMGEPALSRKVCYDVVTLEGKECTIAVALFSALDANELRCYTLPLTANQAPFKTYSVVTASTPPAAPTEAIGYALAADDALEGAVFVAAGTGGLIRVVGLCGEDTPEQTSIQYLPDPQPGLPSGATYPFASGSLGHERVVDVDTIESAEGVGRVYALLDYGRIIGYDISGGTWNTTELFAEFLDADELVFARHIQAIVLHPPTSIPTARQVLLTVASQASPILGADHGAPFFVTGRWSAGFGVGILDTNLSSVVPTPPATLAMRRTASVYAYTEDLLTTSALTSVNSFPLDVDNSWRAMNLRPVSTSGAIICRNYECTTGGLAVRRITNPTNVGSTAGNNVVWEGMGRITAPIAVMVPHFNPDFPMFSADNVGPSLLAERQHIDTSGPNPVFADAAGTAFGCTNGGLTLDVPPTPCSGPYKLADINPFTGPTVGGTSWLKYDGTTSTEYVVVGSATVYRQIVACPPATVTNIAPHDPDPCLPTTQWFDYSDSTNGYHAWRVLRLPVGFTGTTSPPVWQQVPSRSIAGAINGCVYMGACGDYRYVTGVPTYQGPQNLFLTRSSTEYGIVAVDGQTFASTVDGATTSGTNGDIVDYMGTSSHAEVLTHPEYRDTAGNPIAGRSIREGVVTGSQSFAFTLSGVVTPFLAAACGTVMDDDDTSSTNDPFEGYEHQSKAILYHVADQTPPAAPIVTPRVLLLRENTANSTPLSEADRSTAMSIRVKRLCDPLTGGTFATYAFVADFNGRLFVYKLDAAMMGSGSTAGFPSGVATPSSAVEPIATLDLGHNVFDGMRHNITSMEIIGSHAYLACVRLGIVVVDLSSPTVPTILSTVTWPTNYPTGVLETPGLTTGLAVRTINNVPTLVAADTRGGYRLYGRP